METKIPCPNCRGDKLRISRAYIQDNVILFAEGFCEDCGDIVYSVNNGFPPQKDMTTPRTNPRTAHATDNRQVKPL